MKHISCIGRYLLGKIIIHGHMALYWSKYGEPPKPKVTACVGRIILE